MAAALRGTASAPIKMQLTHCDLTLLGWPDPSRRRWCSPRQKRGIGFTDPHFGGLGWRRGTWAPPMSTTRTSFACRGRWINRVFTHPVATRAEKLNLGDPQR